MLLSFSRSGKPTDAERLRKVAKVLAAPDLSGKRRINAQTDNITVSD